MGLLSEKCCKCGTKYRKIDEEIQPLGQYVSSFKFLTIRKMGGPGKKYGLAEIAKIRGDYESYVKLKKDEDNLEAILNNTLLHSGYSNTDLFCGDCAGETLEIEFLWSQLGLE